MMNLSGWQRLRLLVFGKVRVGERMRPGWKGPIPLYAFYCEEHGIVMNIPRGYGKQKHIVVIHEGHPAELRCPLCVEEAYKYV